ncbi:MAG: hypothetical protein ACE5GH_06985, partial [Fidelibacterota bacterium]
LELQKVYQEAATESESENAVSQSDREIVIALARRLVSSPLRSPEFPDYTSFLTREFGDENVRRLVLGDLRSILRGKVVLIDSLLTRRKSEMELFTQLRAFHRDLSLQLESDRDLVPAGNGVMSKSQERSYEDVASTFTPTPDGLESLEPPPRSAIFENQIRPGEEVEFRLGSVTIEEDMLRLQSRRRQYQDLLRRIDKELTD